VIDQQWIDKFAIQELIYCHSDAVTRGDLSAFESLYEPDATMENRLVGLRWESARAFVDYFGESTAAADLLIQTAHNPVVRLLNENTARATTTIFEQLRGTLAADSPVGTQGDQVNLSVYGVYYDDVSKSSGQWRFTHRLYVPLYTDQGEAGSEVLTARSNLLAPT
jgi:hypothetical protein